jgi:Tubulin-specific chaperone C N-terminal domain
MEAWTDKRNEAEARLALYQKRLTASVCFLAAVIPGHPASASNLLPLCAMTIIECGQLHLACRSPATEAADRMDAKAAHDKLAQQLFELDRSIATAAYFLPAFEVRNLTELVKQLRTQLQQTKSKILPGQPFQFTCPEVLVLIEDPLQQVRLSYQLGPAEAHDEQLPC